MVVGVHKSRSYGVDLRDSFMKVAMIEPVGGHGGMNYYDFGLCRGLVNAGLKPILYTCDETHVPQDISFSVKLYFVRIYGAAAKLTRAARYVIGLLRSLRDARRWGVSVAHFHLFHTTALEWISVRSIRLFGFKTVITVHDVESFSGDTSKWLSKRIYGIADLIIVHSETSYHEICELAGGLSSKIALIPLGNYIDYIKSNVSKEYAREKIGLDYSGPVILFFGQIKEAKGLDILLVALSKVIKAYPDVRLVIAGKVWRDNFSKYNEFIDKYSLRQNVVCHIKYIPDDMMDYYYNAADIVVLPYKKIYQSAVLIMAMSYGKAVIASDLDGMKEVITDGETGFLFSAGDSADLSAKLIDVLSSPDIIKRVEVAAKVLMMEAYSWEKIGRLTADCYASVKGGGGGKCYKERYER